MFTLLFIIQFLHINDVAHRDLKPENGKTFTVVFSPSKYSSSFCSHHGRQAKSIGQSIRFWSCKD